MPPALTDYTFAFGESGYILNTDNTNTLPFMDVTSIAGLDNAPIRTNTDEREGQDGTYIDAAFLSERTIVITGNLYTDPNDPESVLDLLKQQYGPGSIQPWYFQLPGKSLRFVLGQGGGAQYDLDTNRSIGMTPLQLTVLAGDPYVYDFPAQSNMAVFAAPVGIGIGFNMGFNTGFGANVTFPSAAVYNYGTRSAYPVFTLVGPLVNPVIQDTTNGLAMALNITLTASDTLVIDNRYKTFTLNGTASRRNAYQGIQFFSVPSKTNDTFLLNADSGTGTLQVTLYSTYD
jgi:hypothetical protein